MALVGRSSVVRAVQEGLAAGPENHGYVSLLIGVRGNGKTVLLHEIADEASRQGWIVLRLDASGDGLQDRIIESVEKAKSRYEILDNDATVVSKSVEASLGVNLGPLQGKIGSSSYRGTSRGIGMRTSLTWITQKALEHGTSVLLTVDELHSIHPSGGSRLVNDLQHINSTANMPLAFVGAGLPQMTHTLARGTMDTFFQRATHHQIKSLTSEEASLCLAATVRRGGGHITPSAIALGAGAANGSPYRVQVIGDLAWKVANCPESEIDEDVMSGAIEMAAPIVRKNLSGPAWLALSERDQELVELVALSDESARFQDLARAVAGSRRAVNNRLSRLCDLGYLESPRVGFYRVSNLVPKEDVLAETAVLRLPDERPTDHAPTRCLKWMPRSQAECVLTRGHKGGCRSHR